MTAPGSCRGWGRAGGVQETAARSGVGDATAPRGRSAAARGCGAAGFDDPASDPRSAARGRERPRAGCRCGAPRMGYAEASRPSPGPAAFPPHPPPRGSALDADVRWPPRSSGAARRPAPGHHGGTPRGVAVRTWLTCPGQGQGLPGPAHGVAGPARGLRPRRARLPLAKAGLTGWPSAGPARVGTRDWPECGAPSSAGTSPGQRVADPVTSASACLGARVGGEPCAVSDWPSVTPRRLIPAHQNAGPEPRPLEGVGSRPSLGRDMAGTLHCPFTALEPLARPALPVPSVCP